MAYYSREEQETLFNYCPVADNWRIYSTYPPHIRRIIERGEDIEKYESDGRIIEVTGTLETNQIRIFKPTD